MRDDDVTQDDLLQALVEALAQPAEGDGGRTALEIQEQTGWSPIRVRTSLKRLARRGRLQVRKAPRLNIAGSYSTVPVYSLRQDDPPIEPVAVLPKL